MGRCMRPNRSGNLSKDHTQLEVPLYGNITMLCIFGLRVNIFSDELDTLNS